MVLAQDFVPLLLILRILFDAVRVMGPNAYGIKMPGRY